MKNLALVLSMASVVPLAFAAPVTTYATRAAFNATLGSSITDDYSAPGYGTGVNIFTNSAMSAVLGQTKYTSTGFANLNIVSSGVYCAGCNGSFLLDFTATGFGTSSGVFGVGFDFFNSGAPVYTAFVTYGDGSTQDIALPATPSFPPVTFFGLTSTSLVRSIAFGLPGGGTTIAGAFGLDSLTIGTAVTVPEPQTLALVVLALLGVLAMPRVRGSSAGRQPT